jgi:hypothetical protein
VTTLAIDTDQARRAATVWVAWGDEFDVVRRRIVDDLHRLQLEHAWLGSSLGAAADELWTASSFVRLVADQVDLADLAGTGYPSEQHVDALEVRAGGRESETGFCLPDTIYSPSSGDVGHTHESELRSPWYIDAGDRLANGRSLVTTALAHTVDSDQIRADEFELVRLTDQRVIVVLAGVTDLSRPSLGLSSANRSVRDLDQMAFRSSKSSGVADNEYAQLVWDGLIEQGVPLGSELLIVGHSFGADTALDLAADPSFNGPQGFAVSHVLAAGYHSQPQLEHVPASTDVLVLQNAHDVAVLAEAAADSFDFGWAGLSNLADHADEMASVAIGAAGLDPGAALSGLADLVTLDTGVSTPRSAQTVAVFDGGWSGIGHHPDNYVEYIERSQDPDVTDFLASFAGGSLAVVGVARAIDISVPERRRSTKAAQKS